MSASANAGPARGACPLPFDTFAGFAAGALLALSWPGAVASAPWLGWPLAALSLAWFALARAPLDGPRAFTRAVALGGLGAALLAALWNLALDFAWTPWTWVVSPLISGREVLKIWLAAHGQSIYPPPGTYPFLTTLYTPLFFVLGAGLTRLLGDPALSGMLLTALPYAGAFAVVTLWGRRETGSWAVPLAFAVLAFASVQMALAGVILRPDWLAWMLAYAGAMRFTARDAGDRPWAAALLLGAAMLTKQQTLPVFLALVTLCIWDRSLWRRCLFTACAAGALLGVAALAMQWGTGGAFLIHTLKYPASLAADPGITNWESAVPRLVRFGINHAAPLAAWAACLLAGLARRRFHALDWLLLVQVPFILRLMMTWGAADNYFWGFLPLLYLRLGVAAAAIGREGLARGAAAALLAALCLPASRGFDDPAARATPARPDLSALAREIARPDGPPWLINAEAAPLLLPREFTPRLAAFDAIETQFFERVGYWRFAGSPLHRDIVGRRFGGIILGDTFRDEQVHSVINLHYALESVPDPLYAVYRPLPGAVVEYPVPTDRPVAAEGLTLQVASIDGLDVNQSFGGFFSMTKNEKAASGHVTFSLRKPPGPAVVHVGFHPKVASFGPENLLEVDVGDPVRTLRRLGDFPGTPQDNDKDLHALPASVSFETDGEEALVRFTVRGNARLWFAPTMPLIFRVVPR
ncbi:hypothetical protein NNJEOMEG_01440 [Fundidesulfovibrio magnetotacticus]|uniref:Glycosyltransferase RgtA/B/C/D-like domain-containing protein n=1 Tax=Fundidesulfovibrio magnetotacticus TaxID=2730080 RepID=A0A6V8LUW2_9BACT|nr:hypothetical protein [Fundidesulfovibrio magnetotacticus]GFK93606.1 hypothetical protein NNJEOMEG_01440 [Fundidesulfovibrio magnetotacticus]